MPKFLASFWEKLEERLAHLVLAAVIAVLFTGGSNWIWRVYVAEPHLARLSAAVVELRERYTRCGTREECQRVHDAVDAIESRLSRIEGRLSRP